MDWYEVIEILTLCRPYIESATHETESLHDNYGEYYIQIMEVTETLLERIDAVLEVEEG